jgi:hypothetical protein
MDFQKKGGKYSAHNTQLGVIYFLSFVGTFLFPLLVLSSPLYTINKMREKMETEAIVNTFT